MLYAIASLALALAPTPTTVLLAGARCDPGFTACDNNVDVLEAKVHHIQALKAAHGVLAKGQVPESPQLAHHPRPFRRAPRDRLFLGVSRSSHMPRPTPPLARTGRLHGQSGSR